MGRYDIVFVSNFLSPHQKPFCTELYTRINNRFAFIATRAVNRERLALGYSDLNEEKYVIRYYESEKSKSNAESAINDADVVIIGSAPDSLIFNRLKERKLTFKYSERILKKELTIASFPRFVLGTWLHHRRFSKYPLHMLCASAFEAADLELLGCYKDKKYCWGYFPDLRTYDDIEEVIQKKQMHSILWAGRFIDWKHPEYCVLLADALRKDGYDFELTMIGTGPLRGDIETLIEKFGLSEMVKVCDSMPPDEVRNKMEQTAIYLVTSNREEGWGAVLNESMNSGCAVVVGSMVGAAPYLVEDNINGLIFENESVSDLIAKVNLLMDNNEMIRKVGKNAYFTIQNKWNYQIAVTNLLALIENIKNGAKINKISGPCEDAPLIKDDWYKKRHGSYDKN